MSIRKTTAHHHRRTVKRTIAAALTGVFLLACLTACSDKGVHMPKHRKRRHCDCPTFSLNTYPTTDDRDFTSHPL